LILLVRERATGRLAWRLVAFAALCIASFLFFEPYALFDFRQFAEDVTTEIAHYRQGHPGNEGDAGFAQTSFYIRELARDYGTVLFGLGLAGIVQAWRVRPLQALVLLSFPLAMLLHMSTNRVNFVRTVLPMFAFYAIVIAYGVLTLADAGRWALDGMLRRVRSEALRHRVSLVGAWCLVAVLIAISGVPARVVAAHRAIVDSRIVVAEWLAANAPPQCLVLAPTQLGFDASSLPERCRGFTFDLGETPLARVLTMERATAAEGETRFLLWPRFGFDPRDPAGAERARAWNALPGESGFRSTLWRGGVQEVWVNYRTIERGDPDVGLYTIAND
jgi:hypothetical protein